MNMNECLTCGAFSSLADGWCDMCWEQECLSNTFWEDANWVNDEPDVDFDLEYSDSFDIEMPW